MTHNFALLTLSLLANATAASSLPFSVSSFSLEPHKDNNLLFSTVHCSPME